MKFLHNKFESVMRVALLVAMISSASILNAQHGWTCEPADYANTGEVIATVDFDGTEVTSGTLGAFIGDECRGFVDAMFFPPTGRYVFILICFYS